MRGPRSGAGSMPCSLSMLATVSLLISCPRLLSASRILVYPHRSFSFAIFNMSWTISSFVEGRPALRVLLESYFVATRVRNHRSSVWGVAILAISLSRPYRIFFALAARRRRCASLNRGLLPWISFSTRISSHWLVDYGLLLPIKPTGKTKKNVFSRIHSPI